ncbi:MAG: DUF1924 domain-containing protein [Thiothrix sp.]|nr:DUF1924 domain-containing protein [Thiothrix sp.]
MAVLLTGLSLAGPSVARAETPQDLLTAFETGARAADRAFGGFSAARGELFFNSTHGHDWSCSSCHTTQPIQPGKHAKTGKSIDPLSPNANAERFTRSRKVEKWFRRNCNDVLGRECTALEKGDVLTFLMAVKP